MISPDLMAQVRLQFALEWDGIHGVSHWVRVHGNGLRIGPKVKAVPEVVEAFAFLHDVGRANNGWDPQHGERSAQFVRHMRGMLTMLSDGDFDMLAYACAYHNRGLTEADVTVQACWDADRLDLGRVGIKPDPAHLCTAAAKRAEVLEWAYLRSLAGRRPHGPSFSEEG